MSPCNLLRALIAAFLPIFCNVQVQAQIAQKTPLATRPLVGNLVVLVPRLVLPSKDYWVYINGQIVSAPHGERAIVIKRPLPDGSIEYSLPDVGHIATVQNDELIFVREGSRDKVYETQRHRLAGGMYTVELLTRAIDKTSFPFVWSRKMVTVAAGQTLELTFGIPPNTVEELAPVAVAAGFSLTPNELLERTRNSFNSIVKAYEADAVVTAIAQVQLNLSYTPPARPKVFVNIPEANGGGRELDIQQMNLVLEKLFRQYKSSEIEQNSELLTASAPIPELARILSLQIDQQNKRIDSLSQIVKALEQTRDK